LPSRSKTGWLHSGGGSAASVTHTRRIRVSCGERLSLLDMASADRTSGTPVQPLRRVTYDVISATEISRAAAAMSVATTASRTLRTRRISSNSARWT